MEYIAHYRKKDQKIQTVEEHSNNVSNFCSAFGKTVEMSSLAKLAGMLHDMGKLSDEFQAYMNKVIDCIQSGNEKEIQSIHKVDHGKYGAMYVYHKFHGLGGYASLTAEIIAIVICYHHGGLRDLLVFNNEKTYCPLLERMDLKSGDTDYDQVLKRYFDRISENEIEKLFFQACKEIEELNRKFIEYKDERMFWFHLLIKQIYSMLIDADRFDTFLFMDDKDEKNIDVEILWREYLGKVEDKVLSFRETETESELEGNIKRLRLEISDVCSEFADNDAGIYTLTVPTGGGKTLSSLRFAIRHAIKKHKKRIIYILPYTTIIEQNAEVVREVLDCGDYLLEHHSNVINDNKEEHKLLTDRWDSPIIFTTMVQFLDTIYAGGTQTLRRMHNLSDAILIFDEIQTIPIKCISLFNSAVNYLSAICNTTVILCSATQPALFETKIPLIKGEKLEIIPNMDEKFENFQRMKVVPQTKSGGYTYEQLGEFVYELKEKCSSILIVLNTIATAEKTFAELKERNAEEKSTIYYLSTNLCPAHRKGIIKEIKEGLERSKSIICVSTQLIEAGVDISFDCVIRSVAGLDSIAQATGRGNRHGKNQIGYSYIVNIADEKLNSLTEIRLGAAHTIEVLEEYRKNPEYFHHNLLSPIAIERYYDYYYSDDEIRRQMNYPIKKENASIYEMLTTKKARAETYKESTGIPCKLILNCLFERAGKEFQVIDSPTTSILVPYGEGKTIITELLSSDSLENKLSILKRAQQYSVNVYNALKSKLEHEGALDVCPITGALMLIDGFYHEELGVTGEKNMDFLEVNKAAATKVN